MSDDTPTKFHVHAVTGGAAEGLMLDVYMSGFVLGAATAVAGFAPDSMPDGAVYEMAFDQARKMAKHLTDDPLARLAMNEAITGLVIAATSDACE